MGWWNMKNYFIVKWKYLFFLFLGISALIFASFWTEWDEYPTNPVLDPVNRAYYPSVVFNTNAFNGHGDVSYYKMWFATRSGGSYGIAYAFSDDGINWTEYNNSTPLSVLQINANHPVVLYNSSGFGGGSFYYKIWYWTGTAGTTANEIRHAESINGITWQNDQPIQQHASDQSLQLIDGVSGSYFYHLYGPGCVLFNPAPTNVGSGTPDDKSDDEPMTYSYVMYYDSSGEGSSPNGSIEQESLAYSVDGIYWIRYGNEPVLLPSGNSADWDGMYTYRASVDRINGTYHMWYAGASGDNSIGTYYAHGIGHATSNDGLTWIKDPDNPAFHVTDGVGWRDVRSYTPCVIYDSNRFSGHGDICPYKIWFTGRTNSPSTNYTIGYATICPSPPPIQDRVGDELFFNGEESFDPDGDEIVEYLWSLSSSPLNSSSAVTPTNQANSSFIPDMEGTYSICLMVASRDFNGMIVWSEPECIEIIIQGYSYCNCPAVSLAIEQLEDRMWHEKFNISRLSWTTTRIHPACEIVRYRIYRMEGETWNQIAEVGENINSFDDEGVDQWYEYRVVPIYHNGNECIDKIRFSPYPIRQKLRRLNEKKLHFAR